MNWHICHKRKLLFFVHIFDISPCVFTQISSKRACWKCNLIPHPTITHNVYFWWTPLPQKQEIHEKTWWWCHHHSFSGISYFWGSRVRQKYAMWVLIGCGIGFLIQWALSQKHREICQKYEQKKVVFFYDKYVNSTIMVDSFYWNYIGSWIPIHKIYYWCIFL